ncbi:glycosyl transferase GT28 family [Butyrivibrio proteoclasticus B316]|uniref:Glycosyl transferase GT28 family n=1 Tax=Butyrivibrio proteoclasticus (strain ATCC 51982 / DSM 14932 / B316) TaxID=515622 RepID=E0RX77_BUTPB|nr:glycosyltransferase [Butyrivibrio proteoclasticus]ADL35288.1 glycosyl transferase GT28 family [Butyrivibrio proteoclasticus B316]
MDKKLIWIKANGNSELATGHIRRCMTIASELMRNGMDVEFILSDEYSANVLINLSDQENTAFDARILHTIYSEPMGDIPVLQGMLQDQVPDFFLMDSPFITPEYVDEVNRLFEECGHKVATGYIDDFNKNDYPVDLIINYDVSGPKDIYSARIKLLGGQFAPLRSEFGQTEYVINRHAKRAFLSAGGTDSHYVLGDILAEIYEADSPCRKVLDNSGLCCDVIVGALFEADYKRRLQEMADRHKAITLHSAVGNDMAAIMSKCDFAVSAGGATMYELCAVGVPTVIFSFNDKQADFAKGFDKAGAGKYAGDARDDHRLVQKIVTWGTAAVDNPGFRSRMSKKAKEIIDGKGTEKIADAILNLLM